MTSYANEWTFNVIMLEERKQTRDMKQDQYVENRAWG